MMMELMGMKPSGIARLFGTSWVMILAAEMMALGVSW
jgi:hypothetical protein